MSPPLRAKVFCFYGREDIVFYPSPTPKREWKYRVLTIDGKCSFGSKQGYNKEEWVLKFEDNVTCTPKRYIQ